MLGWPVTGSRMYEQVSHLFPELDRDLRGLSNKTGVLPSQKIRELVENGNLSGCSKVEEGQIQPSSIDLRLGPVAYRVRASFLPGPRCTVENKIKHLIMTEMDLRQPTAFEQGCVYIVPLVEELRLPRDISAKANPKSTTGRLDVFTRLICDYGNEFERVPEGYKGKLYAEVVPRTFTIIVSEGIRLNQLRFMRGCPLSSDARLEALDKEKNLVYAGEDEPQAARIDEGLRISVNLQPDKHLHIIGYRAKKNAPAIDLANIHHYDVTDFWEPIPPPPSQAIILNPGDFHILISKEKVRVPHDHAAEMVAYDPAMGEFRIHYAGFFDPGFGYGSSEMKGTCAVLEVRSHEAPFLIEDGQVVGRLIYERLLTQPDKVYGSAIGSSYQGQGLTLSRQFKPPTQREP